LGNIILVMALAAGMAAQEKPKHMSEYMQQVALIYLDTAHSEEIETARTLENESQEKLLDDIEARINIRLQHVEDSPEKDADKDFMLLLGRVRILAGAAGLEINQSKKDGPATKAWAACFGFARTAAESGIIYPQIAANCDSLYEAYSKALKERSELASKCSTLKKKKDQHACEAGKIPPP
jgi:hypothetical protein